MGISVQKLNDVLRDAFESSCGWRVTHSILSSSLCRSQMILNSQCDPLVCCFWALSLCCCETVGRVAVIEKTFHIKLTTINHSISQINKLFSLFLHLNTRETRVGTGLASPSITVISTSSSSSTTPLYPPLHPPMYSTSYTWSRRWPGSQRKEKKGNGAKWRMILSSCCCSS